MINSEPRLEMGSLLQERESRSFTSAYRNVLENLIDAADIVKGGEISTTAAITPDSSWHTDMRLD